MTDTDGSTIRPIWVVLRRSQNRLSPDRVTVAFQSDDRDYAEAFMIEAREIQQDRALYPDIYELAEC